MNRLTNLNHKLISAAVAAVVVCATLPAAAPAFAQGNPPPATPKPTLNQVKLPKSAQLSRQLQGLTKQPALTQFLTPSKGPKPSVSFDGAMDYRHDSGLFNIQIPGKWKQTDLSNENDLHIAFIDPTSSALFLIRITKTEEALSAKGLAELLASYLNGQFESENNYQPGDPEEVSEGVIGARFAFDGKNRSMVGDGYALQNGPLASTVVFLSDANLYDGIREPAHEVISSFRLSPGASEPGQTQASPDAFALDELTTYTHPSGAFEIDAPAKWEVITKDDPGSLLTGWVEQGGRGEIVVEMVKMQKKFTKAQMVQVVGNYTKEIYGKKDLFNAEKPKSASNDIAYTFFKMRRDAGDETLMMVGIVYAFQDGNNVLFLREIVPQGELENAAKSLDAIANSVKINPNAQYLR